MKTIAENTVTWGGADLSMAFRIEGLTARERAQLASHLMLVVQDAVDTLNDDGQLLFVPITNLAPDVSMLDELRSAQAIDTAALDDRIRELLGASAAPAPVVEAPKAPVKRKRRTRAEIEADNAAAAASEAAAEATVEAVVEAAEAAVVAHAVEDAEAEAEEVAAAVEVAAVVSTKPAHPQSKAKVVETSTLKVDDEAFTVVWSQTGGHISGKIVIPKALADRLGGEPTTLTETSDSKTSVKGFLTEAVGDYLAAILFKKQQAATVKDEEPAPKAKDEEPAPKAKAKAAPKAAPKAVADNESPAIPPACLQQVIANPDPDGAARSKFVSDWVEHLFKNRQQLGIKSAEEAGAWCMKHQGVVTWFVKKPLGGATPRAVAAAWSVYTAEEAAKLGNTAFDDEDGDDEAFGQVA